MMMRWRKKEVKKEVEEEEEAEEAEEEEEEGIRDHTRCFCVNGTTKLTINQSFIHVTSINPYPFSIATFSLYIASMIL